MATCFLDPRDCICDAASTENSICSNCTNFRRCSLVEKTVQILDQIFTMVLAMLAFVLYFVLEFG